MANRITGIENEIKARFREFTGIGEEGEWFWIIPNQGHWLIHVKEKMAERAGSAWYSVSRAEGEGKDKPFIFIAREAPVFKSWADQVWEDVGGDSKEYVLRMFREVSMGRYEERLPDGKPVEYEFWMDEDYYGLSVYIHDNPELLARSDAEILAEVRKLKLFEKLEPMRYRTPAFLRFEHDGKPRVQLNYVLECK